MCARVHPPVRVGITEGAFSIRRGDVVVAGGLYPQVLQGLRDELPAHPGAGLVGLRVQGVRKALGR